MKSDNEEIHKDNNFSGEHLKYLSKTEQVIETDDGVKIELYEFDTVKVLADNLTMSRWAKHFRNNYCSDSDIDSLRMDNSRKDYLSHIKFPDPSKAPGPSTMSGDFGEILISDFLSYMMGYWVPRYKYAEKATRNESVKGVDVVGFKCNDPNKGTPDDTLIFCEAKARLKNNNSGALGLQKAINDSAKRSDEAGGLFDIGVTLNSHFQRSYIRNHSNETQIIERFQRLSNIKYKIRHGAASLFTADNNSRPMHLASTARKHRGKSNLILIAICGKDFMQLVRELYRIAADEA